MTASTSFSWPIVPFTPLSSKPNLLTDEIVDKQVDTTVENAIDSQSSLHILAVGVGFTLVNKSNDTLVVVERYAVGN